MKAEYDFSNAERGKFYRSDAELNIPIYLEADVAQTFRELAQTTDQDVTSLVNRWLRQDIALLVERTTMDG